MKIMILRNNEAQRGRPPAAETGLEKPDFLPWQHDDSLNWQSNFQENRARLPNDNGAVSEDTAVNQFDNAVAARSQARIMGHDQESGVLAAVEFAE